MYRKTEFEHYEQPTLLPKGQYSTGGIVFSTGEIYLRIDTEFI